MLSLIQGNYMCIYCGSLCSYKSWWKCFICIDCYIFRDYIREFCTLDRLYMAAVSSY